MGDSLHIQNIHINNVIGENEKKNLLLYRKKLNGLFGQLSICIVIYSYPVLPILDFLDGNKQFQFQEDNLTFR